MTDDDTFAPAFALGTAAAGLEILGRRRAAAAAAIAAAARHECLIRRQRVLRYPDLVAAMAGPPLRLDAHRWNGFVPPRTCQEQLPEVLHSGSPVGHAGRPNGRAAMTGPTELNIAPYRAAFVEICAEAYRRDVEAGLAPAAPSGDPAGPDAPDGRAQLEAVPDPGQAVLGWPEGSAGEAANP